MHLQSNMQSIFTISCSTNWLFVWPIKCQKVATAVLNLHLLSENGKETRKLWMIRDWICWSPTLWSCVWSICYICNILKQHIRLILHMSIQPVLSVWSSDELRPNDESRIISACVRTAWTKTRQRSSPPLHIYLFSAHGYLRELLSREMFEFNIQAG